MTDSERLNRVLVELLEMEASESCDLSTWYERAKEINKLDNSAIRDLPELVWHFLSDADIRRKESGYGKEQIKAVKELLQDNKANDT